MTTSSTAAPAATPGTWQDETINGMQYEVLLPANYNPAIKYPTVLYLHQLDLGDYGASTLENQINAYFNTAQFRAAYPAIFVAPLLDQTADPSGQTINFGGITPADQPGEDNAIAALKQVMSEYSTDPSRVYLTGNSMGGDGTWDMMIKYNAYDGTEGKIFAAGMPLAGIDYDYGEPPPQSVVQELKDVPIWAIHGAQDTQQVPTWDQNMYAAEQAIGGDMKLTLDPNLGHDVWDTYYPLPNGQPYWDWLFSQSASGSTSPPPAKPSANDTVVKAGSTAAITDASGNTWTIDNAQVAVNGAVDTTTANVTELAYVNGEVWQENASKLWWGKTSPSAAWSPAAGTTTSPLPASAPKPSANDTVVKAGSTAAIVDASGNTWTIDNAQVAVNGAVDTTTANVTELAYVNGEVWQENASKLWWGKTSPSAAWSPAAGTATSPLPASAPKPSANDTVVKAGSTAAITDASGNTWTITAGGQVAMNGTADTTTANVTELAYVNGEVWQENGSDLWWGKTSPTAAWSPAAGTATSPLPASTGSKASANDTVVKAGAAGTIVDASGNKWTITSAGQVAVNGTADTTTAKVIELAYVNGEVWQENASDLWWGKTSPTAAWSPAAGTSTSPLPAPTSSVAAAADTALPTGNASPSSGTILQDFTTTLGEVLRQVSKPAGGLVPENASSGAGAVQGLHPTAHPTGMVGLSSLTGAGAY